MTKKDYELIAGTIKNFKFGWIESGGFDTGEIEAIDNLSNNLALELQAENPKFDRTKFLEACGIEG